VAKLLVPELGLVARGEVLKLYDGDNLEIGT
jgi:hypothetical protein